MKKSAKKKELMLLGLLLLFVLILGGFVWYSKQKSTGEKEQTKEVETSTIALATLEIEDINWFHYEYDTTNMTFSKSGEEWQLETDKNRPMNQAYINNMLKLIDDVVAMRVITESPEDISEYGLTEPYIYAEAKTTDGKTTTLTIGDPVINNNGYYAMVNDDQTVYMIAASYGTGFCYKDADMTAIEVAPTISADTIYHILVEQKDKETFELKYNPDNAADYTGLSMYPWTLPQPYDTVLTADGTLANEAINKFTSIRYTSCVEYDSKDLSIYGLDDPRASIFLEYFNEYTVELDEPEIDSETGEEVTTKTIEEEASYKINIGNDNGEGYYYVMPDGTNKVYTLLKETVDTMLEVQSFDCLNPYIHLINIDYVDKVEVDIDGTVHTMEITREAGKDDEGNDTTIPTYYHDGEIVDGEVFRQVYQVLISARYDAVMNKELPESMKPYVTVTFHRNNEKEPLVFKYIPYNDSFYIVDNGSYEFFADARKIELIAKTITDFKVEQ